MATTPPTPDNSPDADSQSSEETTTVEESGSTDNKPTSKAIGQYKLPLPLHQSLRFAAQHLSIMNEGKKGGDVSAEDILNAAVASHIAKLMKSGLQLPPKVISGIQKYGDQSK